MLRAAAFQGAESAGPVKPLSAARPRTACPKSALLGRQRTSIVLLSLYSAFGFHKQTRTLIPCCSAWLPLPRVPPLPGVCLRA